jgi:hypothetical protein
MAFMKDDLDTPLPKLSPETFLDYEMARQGMDGVWTENECLMTILEAAKCASAVTPSRGGDEFWSDAVRQVLGYAMPALYSATGTLSISDIIRFVSTHIREMGPEHEQAHDVDLDR